MCGKSYLELHQLCCNKLYTIPPQRSQNKRQ